MACRELVGTEGWLSSVEQRDGAPLDRVYGHGHHSGATDVEYFAPIKFRLEPDLLVTVLGGLVYSGAIVLAITGDKIDSGKIALLVERPLDELRQFKHVEAPKEINVAVLRSLFELLSLSPGLAQLATQVSIGVEI